MLPAVNGDSLSFNVNVGRYWALAEMTDAVTFLGLTVYRLEQRALSLSCLKWRDMDQGCVAAFTKMCQIGLVRRFGKFCPWNLTMEAIILRKETMKRHLNSQNATKCSTVTTCKSVKYFTVSLCSFMLHFVKNIDGNFRKTISWKFLSAV